MPTYSFRSLRGAEFRLKMPYSFRKRSAYVLAPPKAGSVLLDKLVRGICGEAKLPYFDLEPQVFPYGIPMSDCPLETFALLEKRGYVFGGFRTVSLLAHVRQYRRSTKIVLVRDPRDMLVSFYFSIANSHALPLKEGDWGRSRLNDLRERASATPADQYIAAGHADHVVLSMREMMHHVKEFEHCHVFRYEDVIFDKRNWIAKICELLGANIPSRAVDALAQAHDVRPYEERPDQHIRQVTPGNFSKHLPLETIRGIEARFADIMGFFGYPACQGTDRETEAVIHSEYGASNDCAR